MKWDKRWLGGAALILAIALPLAVRQFSGPQGTPIDIAVAAEEDVRPSVLASGTLTYNVEVDLRAEVTARVIELAVAEGDRVEEGQLLLRLDPETYNAIIAREEASVRQNRITIDRQRAVVALRRQQYERSQKLAEARLIDQNRLDEDRNQWVVAEADLRSSEEALTRAMAVLSDAREQRAKTEIRSPVAGRVISLPIKVGEVAIPSTGAFAGAQLMKIADVSAIQAEVKVDEADVAKIRVDQLADVFAAAYQDTALAARVEKIALTPTLEGQGRSYLVTLTLDAPADLLLRSGMSARAVIYLGDGQRRLAVPVEAIITENPEKNVVQRYVWLDRDGKAQKIGVTTGLSDDRWEVIESGISVGDRVIIGPQKTLRRLRVDERVSEREASARDDSSESDTADGTDGE